MVDSVKSGIGFGDPVNPMKDYKYLEWNNGDYWSQSYANSAGIANNIRQGFNNVRGSANIAEMLMRMQNVMQQKFAELQVDIGRIEAQDPSGPQQFMLDMNTFTETQKAANGMVEGFHNVANHAIEKVGR